MWINRAFRDVNSLTYFLNENDKIISNVNISVAPRKFGLIYFVAVFKVEEGKENELIETDL
jgi:hypothetical protein